MTRYARFVHGNYHAGLIHFFDKLQPCRCQNPVFEYVKRSRAAFVHRRKPRGDVRTQMIEEDEVVSAAVRQTCSNR